MSDLAYGTLPDPLPMTGPDGPRDALSRLLLAGLARKIELLRRDLSVGLDKLPPVRKISSGELPRGEVSKQADAWVEIINPRQLPGLSRVDISPAGDPVYSLKYACRLFVWTIGANWGNSIDRRDLISLAVKTLILEFPTLSMQGGDTGWCVLEETWTEEYGMPTEVGNESGRCWCSAGFSLDIRAEQALTPGRMRKPIGEATTVAIVTDAVGPTQPIPHNLPTPPGWATPELPNDQGSGGIVSPPPEEPVVIGPPEVIVDQDGE